MLELLPKPLPEVPLRLEPPKLAPELLLPTEVPPLAPRALRACAISLARAYLIGITRGLMINGVSTSIFLTISTMRSTFSA